jgi:hypothetical protein
MGGKLSHDMVGLGVAFLEEVVYDDAAPEK